MELFFMGLLIGFVCTIIGYEIYYKRKANKVKPIFPPKLELLLETTTLETSKKRKELQRELTDMEKNLILDDCYKKI